MEQTTDQMLLDRLPADDAVRALYERYSRLVYSTCLGVLGDTGLAEDATQSVFLVLLGRAHELRRHTSLAAYLYLTSVRAALAIVRSEKARQRRERAAADVTQVPKPGFEARHDLVLALAQLGSVERELVVLRFGQQLSFEEIGREANLTADAARMRVERALVKLRRKLRGADVLASLPLAFADRAARKAFQTPTFRWSGLDAAHGLSPSKGFLLMNSHRIVAAVVTPLLIAGIAVKYETSQVRPTAPVAQAQLPKQPVPASAFTMPAQFGTAHGPYRLAYDFTETSASSGADLDRGTLTLTESDGALLFQVQGKTGTQFLCFSSGKTLSVTVPADKTGYDPGHQSSMLQDGFIAAWTPPALLLPFNFAGHHVFGPLSEYYAQLDQATGSPRVVSILRDKSYMGDSNISLAIGPGPNRQGVAAGQFTRVSDDECVLTTGETWAKGCVSTFSAFREACGVKVPAKISLVVYDWDPTDHSDKPHTVPFKKFALSLSSIETDPAKIEKPSPESILVPGQWVSYNGYNGKVAGVMFDPKTGSFEGQLQAQLKARAYSSGRP